MMKIALALFAISTMMTATEVQQPALPEVMDGCKVRHYEGISTYVMQCGKHGAVVQLAYVQAVPRGEEVPYSSLASIVYDSEREDRFSALLKARSESQAVKKEDTDGLFTLKPVKVLDDGTVVGVVFVATGKNAGQNASIILLNEGSVVASNDAPPEYKAASDYGTQQRQVRAKYAAEAKLRKAEAALPKQ